MPKKRKSTEPDNDEQANESSGSLSQNEDNAKRAKRDLPSDTTLQDLPIEILELILIKAVVVEVKGLKLAKCAWKEKADPVISRLRPVCLQWSNILASNYFQTQVYKSLNDTAPDTIRLEVLQELSVKEDIHAIAALKDEIFAFSRVREQYYVVNVYDRHNMEEVKDVIPLPKSYYVSCITACNASNCLYVGILVDNPPVCTSRRPNLTVLRIWKDGKKHQFKTSPWKNAHDLSIHMLTVSANGNLLTFTGGVWSDPASVAVYDANDSLQLEVFLPRDVGLHRCNFRHVLQKSNGNLVASFVDQDRHTNLLEIDTTGSVVRQYQSPLGPYADFIFADDYCRIILTDLDEPMTMELLDSEFNQLGIYSLEQDVGKSCCVYDLYYDRERNEIVRNHYDRNTKENVLTTFRFAEE